MADKRVELIFGAKDQTGRAMGTVERGLSGVQKMGVLVGTTLGALGLASLARDFVQVNAEVQKLSASLNTVTGSTEEADKAFAMLRNFATETPFQVAELVDAFIKMKALGLDPNIETMRSFGDTASAMGKSLDQMVEAVADASTGEFERLKEFGIKTKQEGDRVVFTFRGVETNINKDSASIVNYLRRIGDEQFAGGMIAQMNTIDGAFSNLQDSYSNLLAEMGSGAAGQTLIDAMNELSGRISDPAFVDAMSNFASGAAYLAQFGIDGFVGMSTYVSRAAEGLAMMIYGTDAATERDRARWRGAVGGTIGPETPGFGDYLQGGRSSSGGASGSVGGGLTFDFNDPNDHSAQLDAFLVYKEERELAEFELRMFVMEQQNEQRLFEEEMTLTRLERLRFEAEEETRIRQESAHQQVQIDQALANARMGLLGSTLGAMATLTQNKSKAIFLAQKAFAIGSAVMSAFQASALALATPPGPPVTIPMSKLAFKMGMYNAAGIAATQIASGVTAMSGADSPGYGGGTPNNPIVTQPAAQLPAPERGQEVNVYIYGNVMDNDKMARDLTESISKALKDGKEF